MKPKIEPIFITQEFLHKDPRESAEYVNAKIEKLLGPKVRLQARGINTFDTWTDLINDSDTHEGWIFNARPIENRPACEGGEHEPTYDGVNIIATFKCKHCKKPIKPAKWEISE